MKEFIFLVLNTNHIYIQPIGSKEGLKTGSSSGISYKKKCEKNDSLSFFPFFCYSPQYYDTLESSCYFFACAGGFILNYLVFFKLIFYEVFYFLSPFLFTLSQPCRCEPLLFLINNQILPLPF